MDTSDFYVNLKDILPRYFRILPNTNEISNPDSNVQQLFQNEETILHRLKFVSLIGSWYCLPGYFNLSRSNEKFGCLYPMDISSALPALIMNHLINSARESKSRDESLGSSASSNRSKTRAKVLDLCCCPGSKYQLISDVLKHNFDTSLIAGIDISLERLNTCKSLLYKRTQLCCQAHVNLAKFWDKQFHDYCSNHRQLLFHSDGTTFSHYSHGTLLYDSSIVYHDVCKRVEHYTRYQQKGQLPSDTTSSRAIHNNRKSTATDFEAGSSSSASEDKNFLNQTSWENAHKSAFPTRKRMNKSTFNREKSRLRLVEKQIDQCGCLNNQAIETSTLNRGAPTVETIERQGLHNEILQMEDFDYVFVDAECTHSGSYRHMQYIDPLPEPPSTSAPSYKPVNSIVLELPRAESCGIQAAATFEFNDAVNSTDPFRKPLASQKFNDISKRDNLMDLQHNLITNGYKLLKPGGYLLYSTCCLNKEENEEVVKWFLQAEPTAQLVPCPSACAQSMGYISSYSSTGGDSVGHIVKDINLNCTDGNYNNVLRTIDLIATKLQWQSESNAKLPSVESLLTAEEIDLMLSLSNNDLKSFFDRLSIEQRIMFSNCICKRMSEINNFPVLSSQLLPGTVYCSKAVGMSGLFLAILMKRELEN